MAALRLLDQRRGAVTGIHKVTRTMEMVAAARAARAFHAVMDSRPYAEALAGMLGRALAAAPGFRHPLLEAGTPGRAAVLLFTGDRGLCGSFNGELIGRAQRLKDELAGRGFATEFIVQGRKGASAARLAGWELSGEYLGVSDKPSLSRAEEMGRLLAGRFVAGEIGEAWLVYAAQHTRQTTPSPRASRLLPLEPPRETAGGLSPTDMPFHPSAGDFLEAILPAAVQGAVFTAMNETDAAEQTARWRAMQNATVAADKMLDELRRACNRARQQKITREITEIVAGGEAL